MSREHSRSEMTDEELAGEMLPNRPLDHALRAIAGLTPEQRQGYVDLILVARRLEAGEEVPGTFVRKQHRRRKR